MARITCLIALSAHKEKLKGATAGIVQAQELCELTYKEPEAEESCCCEMGNPATLDVGSKLSFCSTTPALLSEPPMAKWTTSDKSFCLLESNGHLPAEPAKRSPVELSEFETRDIHSTGSDESERVGRFTRSLPHIGNAVGELAYEGGDEDDEFENVSSARKYRNERHSDGSAEILPDKERSESIPDNGSATSYDFQTNMAGNVSRCFFDEGISGDYVSDPGVYDTNDLELGLRDELLPGSHFGRQSRDTDSVVKETRSEGGLSDLELTSQQVSNNCTRFPMLRGKGSSQDLSIKEMSVAFSRALIKSSHSEIAMRKAEDSILKVKFSEKGPKFQKQKPWWKVFLVTHRNIHREQNGVVASTPLSEPGTRLLSNAVSGYCSDVDYPGGGGMILQDLPHHEFDKVKIGFGLGPNPVPDPKGVEQGLQTIFVREVGLNDVNVFHTKPVPSLALPLSTWPHVVGKGKEVQATHLEKPDMRSVEEWVNSIDPVQFSCDEELQMTDQLDALPDSPTASAASFFRMRASRDHLFADHAASMDRRDHHGDVLLDADAEMANMIARSVNTLSTFAHFSGVGLRLVPPLGLYNNLKTLNLSANAIVRIVPGHLPKSLHSLDLSRNKIVVIEGLRELTRLRVLNISYNRVSRIGHGLANCTSLRELHLSGNKVSDVEGLHRLLKLGYIDLSFNKLTSSKSIAQLAANYNSLQAINLLGNAIHINLGDEALRKLVCGLAPHVLYLNKQAMKAVPARDATVDSVARAALGTSSHHAHQRGKTIHSKAPRRVGPTVLPSGPTSHHARTRNRDKGGSQVSGGSRANSSKVRVPAETACHHRYSQGQGAVKAPTRTSHSAAVQSTAYPVPVTGRDGRISISAVEKVFPPIPHIKSGGSLHPK